MKFVSIDLETTGRNPMLHNVIEFGAVIEDTQHLIPVEELPYFKCYVLYDNYTVEKRLMAPDEILPNHHEIYRKISRHQSDWRNLGNNDLFLAARNVGKQFKEFLLYHGFELMGKMVTITAAGKNFASFDLQFIKQQLPNFYNHVVIKQTTIDPSIFLVDWKNDKALPNLTECLERVDIGEDTVSHETISDCRQVLKVLRQVTNNYTIKLF